MSHELSQGQRRDIDQEVWCAGGSPKGQSEPPLTVVQGDDVEAVEQLAFIFMNPLHLDVEERVGVDVDFVFPL